MAIRFPRRAKTPRLVHREDAAHPAAISARGWRELLWSAILASLKHRAPSQAAAATFYAFLAFVPGVAAFGSAYGLIADPERLEARLAAFTDIAPAGVLQMVLRELTRFADGPPLHLLPAAVGFTLVALGSATSAVRNIMIGLATAYDVEDTRPWWAKRLVSAVFAAGVMALSAATIGLILKSADMEDTGVWAIVRLVLRWAALYAASVAALAVLYRYGPARPRSRWRWVTPGSAMAAFVGLASSVGVTLYLARVAAYERTYGGLGTILGMMVWMWSAMVVIIVGAELNHAMEAQTTVDTSVRGRPAPEVEPAAADAPPTPAR